MQEYEGRLRGERGLEEGERGRRWVSRMKWVRFLSSSEVEDCLMRASSQEELEEEERLRTWELMNDVRPLSSPSLPLRSFSLSASAARPSPSRYPRLPFVAPSPPPSLPPLRLPLPLTLTLPQPSTPPSLPLPLLTSRPSLIPLSPRPTGSRDRQPSCSRVRSGSGFGKGVRPRRR